MVIKILDMYDINMSMISERKGIYEYKCKNIGEFGLVSVKRAKLN